jgi:hypothetical protein
LNMIESSKMLGNSNIKCFFGDMMERSWGKVRCDWKVD